MATKMSVHSRRASAGHFDALFSRVGKIHASKAGPFHALLCVGSFFGRKGSAELAKYISGQAAVPLPTYFIAGDEFDTKLIDSLPAGGTLCANLHYLGRAGVQSLSLGPQGGHKLTVAYLSGLYDQSSYFGGGSAAGVRNVKYEPNYIEEDVLTVMRAGIAAPHVDVLLTAEWGRGWQMHLPADKMPSHALTGAPHASAAGSPAVAKLAQQIPARYHFAGLQDAYFELPPYRNKHFITRFFGLAKTVQQGERKEKNLYACNVSPFASLDRSNIPAEVTSCPYTVAAPKQPPVPHAAASSSSAHHPFPSEESSNKRQRLDHSGAAHGAGGDRFAPGFLNSMQAYDAASAGSNGAMRWNLNTKDQKGPPPPSYVCRICEEPGHWIEQCPKKHTSGRVPDDYVCRKCNQPGHLIRNCPLVLAEEASRPHRGNHPDGAYVCRKCNQPGHPIRECPLILAEEAAGRSDQPPPPSYVCKKCNAAGQHYVRLCPLVQAENEARAAAALVSGVPLDKMPPLDYICKVCSVPGHWIRDCPVVAAENAARASAGIGGAAAPGSHLDANGMPVGTKTDCWFCLATEHVSTHLILSVGGETYLALAKGALEPEHVLILPIVHVSSSLDLSPEQRREVEAYKLALRRYYRSQGGRECLMYERFIPTKAAQHMHIQIIPLTRAQARAARGMLDQSAKDLSPDLTFVPLRSSGGGDIKEANPNRSPFVLFELPEVIGEDDSPAALAAAAASAALAPASAFPVNKLVHFLHPRHKVLGLFDFPRSVVASMIGAPERSDWKKVTQSEAEETEMVERMKEKFMPFDFTLMEDEQQTGGAAQASSSGQ